MILKKNNGLKLYHLRTFAVWISLSAYILVVLGGIGTTIVCFGADGHISIESASDYCCGKLSNISSRVNSVSATRNTHVLANNHCGPCIDLPISVSSSKRYIIPFQHTDPQEQTLNLTDFAFIFPPFSKLSSKELPPLPSIKANSTLTFLRTAILLI